MKELSLIIKEMVSTPTLFAHYGFERKTNGFVNCMFHKDRRASMKIYDGSRGYHCFSCKETGDIFTFVQKYFCLSFKDSLSKINEDFHLHLPICVKIGDEKVKKLYEAAEERRKKKLTIQREIDLATVSYDEALGEWIRLDRQRIEYAPKHPNESFHELYIEALVKMDYYKYHIEIAENKLFKCKTCTF